MIPTRGMHTFWIEWPSHAHSQDWCIMKPHHSKGRISSSCPDAKEFCTSSSGIAEAVDCLITAALCQHTDGSDCARARPYDGPVKAQCHHSRHERSFKTLSTGALRQFFVHVRLQRQKRQGCYSMCRSSECCRNMGKPDGATSGGRYQPLGVFLGCQRCRNLLDSLPCSSATQASEI